MSFFRPVFTNLRFCPYTGKCGSKKSSILAYFVQCLSISVLSTAPNLIFSSGIYSLLGKYFFYGELGTYVDHQQVCMFNNTPLVKVDDFDVSWILCLSWWWQNNIFFFIWHVLGFLVFNRLHRMKTFQFTFKR